MPGARLDRGTAAALVVLAAAPALLAQSQPTFYEAYADGQEAMHQGQWRPAIWALERAVQLRPAPAPRVIIYGNNLLTNYYPYSLLARCHLELGETTAAAALLRQAEAKGEPAAVRDPVLRRLPHHAESAPAQNPEPRKGESAPSGSDLSSVAQGSQAPVPHPPPVVPATDAVRAAGAAEPAATAATTGLPPAAPAPAPASPAAPVPATRTGPVPQSEARLPPEPQALSPGWSSGQAPAIQPQPGPDPIRPVPLGFWVVAGTGLAVLAAGLGWRRRGRARSAPAAALPGASPETVGPYRILRTLGHGGFATTYLARHRDSGLEVALKVLHPHRLQDPDFRRRFSQEARLGALLEHPNLVRLLDPGEDEGSGWIALEYVPGPTLEAHLKANGQLPLAEAVAIALGIAEAMAYAHAHGVVHRDLKPANVILSGQGPRVMDLGVARDLDAASQTTTYAFLGTPRYAAPEAQLMAKAGPAADRYSLGVILFEMLTGRQPFQGETPFAIMDQHRSAPVPDPQALRPMPAALARLVERLMAKEPDQRPEDGELVAKLKGVLVPLRGR